MSPDSVVQKSLRALVLFGAYGLPELVEEYRSAAAEEQGKQAAAQLALAASEAAAKKAKSDAEDKELLEMGELLETEKKFPFLHKLGEPSLRDIAGLGRQLAQQLRDRSRG